MRRSFSVPRNMSRNLSCLVHFHTHSSNLTFCLWTGALSRLSDQIVDYILQDGDFLLTEKCVEDAIPRYFSFGRLLPKVKVVECIVAVYKDDPGLFEADVIKQ